MSEKMVQLSKVKLELERLFAAYKEAVKMSDTLRRTARLH